MKSLAVRNLLPRLMWIFLTLASVITLSGCYYVGRGGFVTTGAYPAGYVYPGYRIAYPAYCYPGYSVYPGYGAYGYGWTQTTYASWSGSIHSGPTHSSYRGRRCGY